MPTRTPLRIAIDSGCTFTDCVWLAPRHQGSSLRILKVFSTPTDPAQAIAEAILKIAGEIQDIVVLHGTTVGTNTLLQRKGARVAFVTTAGFEDSIEIGRQQRPKLYDFFFEKDPPLAPAELRFGVDERTSAEGAVLRAPLAASLETLAEQIAAQKPQALAISLLFSFANPANEKAVAAALARLNLPLSVSHQILPEFREYERASTVLVNAYLQPVMQGYLQKLQERLSSGQERAQARVPVPQGPSSQAGVTPPLPRQASESHPNKPKPGLSGAPESLRVTPGGSDAARTAQPAVHSQIFVMQSSGGITGAHTA